MNERIICCDMCSVKPAICQGCTNLDIYANMCENCFKFYGIKIDSELEENTLEVVKPC